MMLRTGKTMACILAVCALIVACGYGHGVLTDRWSVSRELTDAVVRLEKVPRQLGDWLAVKDWEMDPRMKAMGGVEGYIDRVFQNSRELTPITVFLVCGRSGPVSVHTPDLCYQGIGYVMEGEPHRKKLA